MWNIWDSVSTALCSLSCPPPYYLKYKTIIQNIVRLAGPWSRSFSISSLLLFNPLLYCPVPFLFLTVSSPPFKFSFPPPTLSENFYFLVSFPPISLPLPVYPLLSSPPSTILFPSLNWFCLLLSSPCFLSSPPLSSRASLTTTPTFHPICPRSHAAAEGSLYC